MKKILVFYASLEGQAQKIAHRLGDELTSLGVQTTLVNAMNRNERENLVLADYQHLVFGASVHVGKLEKELALFINNHAPEIGDKPSSLFIVSMAAATTDPDRRQKSLAEIRTTVAGQLKADFSDIEMIAGALKYTQYNWFIKWVMKGIAKKEGGSTDTSKDHEYTDWDQVAAYARRLAG